VFTAGFPRPAWATLYEASLDVIAEYVGAADDYDVCQSFDPYDSYPGFSYDPKCGGTISFGFDTKTGKFTYLPLSDFAGNQLSFGGISIEDDESFGVGPHHSFSAYYMAETENVGGDDFSTTQFYASSDVGSQGTYTTADFGDDAFNCVCNFTVTNASLKVVPAVPEPPVLPLFVTGLGMMAWLAWRKQRAAVGT
jgi:hypothetical protein